MDGDKLLSMSLDEIIRMKRTSGRSSSAGTPPKKRKNNATRGKIISSANRRRGRFGVASNRNLRRSGLNIEISYRSNRGALRQRGVRSGQRSRPVRFRGQISQRQNNIALARSRLQVAKRFLNNRQGSMSKRSMSMGERIQMRRTLMRGMGPRIKRGRGGLQISSRFLPNTFRSNKLLALSHISAYRNKMNRSQSAMQRAQVPSAPSLIVSIANERAGSHLATSSRGSRRGFGATRLRGRWQRQNLPAIQSQNMYQQRNAVPFHTGALNPEIQRMIADIQGKTTSTSAGIGNRFSRRGVGGMRGLGLGQGLRRGQFAARRRNQSATDGLNVGLPMTTACTLNERFGGRN